MSYKIINGDCLEVMRSMPDKSVDLVLTDPPYGLDFRGEKWDSFIPSWIAEARRISPIVVFTTAPTTLWDYPRPDWVNCWYRDASNSRAVAGGFNHWSPILVYGKVKFPVDSIKLHAIQNAYPKGFPHPSPKPERLMAWLAKEASNEGETILDPFMGSGTTGVAALKLGRNFIGIEIDPKYCAMAEKRIKNECGLLIGV
jgi:DNA modification methylase